MTRWRDRRIAREEAVAQAIQARTAASDAYLALLKLSFEAQIASLDEIEARIPVMYPHRHLRIVPDLPATEE